jgi:serine/threonine-protein kinase
MAFQCIRCKTEIDPAYKACPHCGEVVTDFLRTYAEAPVDGKYKIVERLGAGGMGEVYKVTHVFLGATRVIKVIRAQISDNKDAHDRFLKEAKIATRIQHPNVATLHDFSALPDGSHYMVWEYIQGEDLAHRIRARGRLQPRYAVRLAIESLLGLDGIHRAGIVHRDISPENIMITKDGDEERVKVIDLGVAKSEDPAESATRVGVFVGKLRYASPEHLGFLDEGERIDGRADLYSMAMVLYEMLMGRPPFEATSPHEYVMLHSRETQFKPLDLPPDLPGGTELQAVMKKALERDRKKRYANAREFAAALEAVERTLPDPKTTATMLGLPTGDEATMHLTPLPKPDTLHRETLRSKVVDSGPTIRTPLPGATAGPTIQAPMPAAAPTQVSEIVARPRRGGGLAIAVIAFLLLFVALAIGGGMIIWNKLFPDEPEIARKDARPVNPDPKPQPPSTTSMDVSTAGPGSTDTTLTIVEEGGQTGGPGGLGGTTTSTNMSGGLPTDTRGTTGTTSTRGTGGTTGTTGRTTTRTETIAPPPPPPPPVEPSIATYIDGDTGDSDVNDALLAELGRQLQGVNRVAIRSSNSEMREALVERIGRETGLTVSDSATTVIDWDATLEDRGRGRKRRAASATISKNGRVIFKYRLPSEDFRVGDTPAEAFARVLYDATNQ